MKYEYECKLSQITKCIKENMMKYIRWMKAVQVITYIGTIMQNSTAGYSNLSLELGYKCLLSHREAITVIMILILIISASINIGKLETKPRTLWFVSMQISG